jgi:hypothetical protein
VKFRAQVAAVKSSLWQSTLKVILLSVAIRATVILFLAIRVLNDADCHNPRRAFEHGTWQETEFQLPPFYIKSFEASYLFAARLLEYKIPSGGHRYAML